MILLSLAKELGRGSDQRWGKSEWYDTNDLIRAFDFWADQFVFDELGLLRYFSDPRLREATIVSLMRHYMDVWGTLSGGKITQNQPVVLARIDRLIVRMMEYRKESPFPATA